MVLNVMKQAFATLRRAAGEARVHQAFERTETGLRAMQAKHGEFRTLATQSGVPEWFLVFYTQESFSFISGRSDYRVILGKRVYSFEDPRVAVEMLSRIIGVCDACERDCFITDFWDFAKPYEVKDGCAGAHNQCAEGQLIESYVDTTGDESFVFEVTVDDDDLYRWLQCWHDVGRSVLSSRKNGVYTIRTHVHRDQCAFSLKCRGAGRHPAHGTLDAILAHDDTWLERQHDYIQWLFPIDVASNFNSTAPLFTQHAQQQFQTNGALQLNLIRSLHRMLTFYGLQLTYDPVDLTTTVVRPASNFAHQLPSYSMRAASLTSVLVACAAQFANSSCNVNNLAHRCAVDTRCSACVAALNAPDPAGLTCYEYLAEVQKVLPAHCVVFNASLLSTYIRCRAKSLTSDDSCRKPTAQPLAVPTCTPTQVPTAASATDAPTQAAPSAKPKTETSAPTLAMTVAPTEAPTTNPTPSGDTTATSKPSALRTLEPTQKRSGPPTAEPSTSTPSAAHTRNPTPLPTTEPSVPTVVPTTLLPSIARTSAAPTSRPAAQQTSAPTLLRGTAQPSDLHGTPAPTPEGGTTEPTRRMATRQPRQTLQPSATSQPSADASGAAHFAAHSLTLAAACLAVFMVS
ncbi:opioid growth factor receptor conserved region-domain-containing protein [Tribonema minus]|uniref:Opioid growth factor receptor conserved region-domain-containing protein n=1 Tax=Tribonema minus TaxID=303371 RepID=A0A835Z012_9STRA|nr:opioid growth factor receptor conserved region-domain-containing protein [Tribonema minus]